MKACALTHKDFQGHVVSWSDIAHHTHLRQNGIQLFDQKLKAYPGQAISDADAIAHMISDQRADIGVMICHDAKRVAQNYENVLILDEQPLETITLYHYVHKKHANMIPDLVTSLQNLK